MTRRPLLTLCCFLALATTAGAQSGVVESMKKADVDEIKGAPIMPHGASLIGRKSASGYRVYWPLSYISDISLTENQIAELKEKLQTRNASIGDPIASIRPEAQDAPKAAPTAGEPGTSVPTTVLGLAINNVFPSVRVQPAFRGVVLYGSNSAELLRALTLLATSLDIPRAQVRTDVFAINVSKPLDPKRAAKVDDKLTKIRNSAMRVRQLLGAYSGSLGDAVTTATPHSILNQDTMRILKKLGLAKSAETVAATFREQKSFTHTLLFLDLVQPKSLVDRRRAQLGAGSRFQVLLTRELSRAKEAGDGDWLATLETIQQRIKEPSDLESRLSEVDADRNAGLVMDFLQAIESLHVRDENSDDEVTRIAQNIQKRVFLAQLVDARGKELTDAIQADLNYIFFEPLQRYVRAQVVSSKSADEGLSSLGSTTIVSSDLEIGALNSQTKVYRVTTPVPSLQGLLDPSVGTSAPTDGQTANPSPVEKAGQGVLEPFLGAGNVSRQASFLLGAMFGAGNQQVVTEIAPGLSIGISPAISPDAGSASMVLDVDYCLGVQPVGQSTNSEPIDRVSKLSAKTKFEVAANDLFEFASMSSAVTLPGDRSRILFFAGPRRTKTVQQGVVLLCNVSILPRALDTFSRTLTAN